MTLGTNKEKLASTLSPDTSSNVPIILLTTIIDVGGSEIQVKKQSTSMVIHTFDAVGRNINTSKILSPKNKDKDQNTSQAEEHYGLVPIVEKTYPYGFTSSHSVGFSGAVQ